MSNRKQCHIGQGLFTRPLDLKISAFFHRDSYSIVQIQTIRLPQRHQWEAQVFQPVIPWAMWWQRAIAGVGEDSIRYLWRIRCAILEVNRWLQKVQVFIFVSALWPSQIHELGYNWRQKRFPQDSLLQQEIWPCVRPRRPKSRFRRHIKKLIEARSDLWTSQREASLGWQESFVQIDWKQAGWIRRRDSGAGDIHT